MRRCEGAGASTLVSEGVTLWEVDWSSVSTRMRSGGGGGAQSRQRDVALEWHVDARWRMCAGVDVGEGVEGRTLGQGEVNSDAEARRKRDMSAPDRPSPSVSPIHLERRGLQREARGSRQPCVVPATNALEATYLYLRHAVSGVP